jgi:hypothetical protein
MHVIRVQLTDRDYVQAVQVAAAPSRVTLIVVGVVSALIVAGASVAWDSGYRREAVITVSVWCGIVLGARVGQVLWIRVQARKVFRQQQGLRRPHEVSWNDAGLTTTADDGTWTLPWADFHNSLEVEDQFILFLSDAIFVMLPKRAFRDSSQMDEFRQSVTTQIRAA